MTKEERELTITYLKDMQEEYIEGEGYERHPLPEWYALYKAIEVLEQTRWIPIGERLPEGFEPVLFTSKNGEIAIGYRDPRFKTYWACIDRADWHHTDFDVVAWMPLPEPYQEGEKK